MQLFTLAVPLALAGFALAGPLEARGVCQPNSCLSAVTGKAALGDDKIRGTHCASYLVTTVTPEAYTTTVTVTGFPGKEGKKVYPRASVTVCPNDVPNYASACDNDAYKSACSCFGFTEVRTTTIDARTTTDTVYVAPTCPTVATETIRETKTVTGNYTTVPATTITVTGNYTTTTCGNNTTAPTSTITVTGNYTTTTCGNYTTVPASTITVTANVTTIPPTTITLTANITTIPATTITITANATDILPVPTSCLTDADAKNLTDIFLSFLTNTNNVTKYAADVLGKTPKGFNAALANEVLSDNFTDTSDSINFMAGIPLGSRTFPVKGAFIGGQSGLAEVDGKTLNVWHSCNEVTWRWKVTPQLPTVWPVVGISHFTVNDKKQIETYHTEFSNAAWLQDFGQNCSIYSIADTGDNALRKRHHDFDLVKHIEE